MDEFIELVKSKYQDPELILEAYDFAKEAHKNEKRLSGEPYIVHPIAVAKYLIDLGLDKETIAAALLHDVVEDTPVSFKKIREKFGSEVEMLVKGVSKISSIKYSKEITEMDSLKRMFIAMSKDIRVILIKLADRMHNVQTVKSLPVERRIKFCTETMNLFVPLADRLGLGAIKVELEDMCFEVLKPEEYQKLKAELERKYDKTTLRMNNIETNLKQALVNLNLKGEVQSRFKHFYSLYKKIKDKGTAKIYDIIAFRILVDKVDDCYRVLGEIHKMYRPVSGRIKDYIAGPKPNGYKSLHTTLITKDGTPFEVQIRTFTMHQYCEYGVAAHWRYKSGDKKKDVLEEKLNWIRAIIQDEKQIKDSENFIKAMQMDFSSSEIWVFTPKYKPISLPEKATPIDMAYAIHTDLGNTCVGARVNNKKVPLNYKLDTGDVVEIITNKDSKGPSREWLRIAVSTNARSHIRSFFRKSIKPENVKKGKEMLEEKANELKIPIGNCLSKKVFAELNKKYLIYSFDDMFASIATGGIKVADIINLAIKSDKILETENKVESPVLIEGSEVDDVKFAHCCTPIPGDEIFAVASNSGITVHCSTCANLKSIDKDRYLSAEWKDTIKGDFDISLRIGGKDEVGIISKIVGIFYDTGTRICVFNAKVASEGRFEVVVSARVKNSKEAEEIINKLEKIENVQFVNRNNLN